MFDTAEYLGPGTVMRIPNVAFAEGTSQHGNARLASDASNCVVAMYDVFLSLPPPALLLLDLLR